LNTNNNQNTDRKNNERSYNKKRPRKSKPIPVKLPVSKELYEIIHTDLDDARYVVFDIETTGGNPEKNGITEIFAIRYQGGKTHDSFYSMVDPEIPVPPIVRRMTGITNKMLKGQPKIEEMMPKFLEFLGDDTLVSHNTIGDMKFLRHFAKQVSDVTMGNFYLCTHLLVEKLASESPDKSLTGLAKFFNLPAEDDAHRAEADAYVTLELFNLLLDRLKEQSVTRVSQGIRLQGDLESAMRLGWAVPPEKLKVPSAPGVFKLFDHQETLLFMSGTLSLSKEIRKLDNYTQLPRQLLRIILRSYDLTVETSDSEYDALLLECEGLKSVTMRFLPQNWHQRSLHSINLIREKEHIKVLTGPIQANTIHAFGPVRDRKEAQAYLEEIAEIFDVKVTRKGIFIPIEYEDILPSFFDGTLKRKIKILEKTRRSIANLLRFAFKKHVSEQISRIKNLKDRTQPLSWKSLLEFEGTLSVPCQTPNTIKVFCIKNGLPIADFKIEGVEEVEDFDLLNDPTHLVKAINELNKKHKSKKISEFDANIINATLWYAHSSRGGRCFKSFKKMNEFTK